MSEEQRDIVADARELSLTACVSFGAVEAGESGAKPKLRKFSMVAYTGGQMDINGWKHPLVIDLAGVQPVGKSRPIFRSHGHGEIVGHTNQVGIGQSEMLVDGVVSGTGASAQEVVTSADNGFPWQASVGVRAMRVEEVKAGEKSTANGREFNGPVLIVRGSVLKEISFVPLGADDNTSSSVMAGAKGKMDKNQDAVLAEEDVAVATDSIAKVSGTTGVDASASVSGTIDALAADREAKAAEIERVSKVEKVAGKHADIAAKAVREGWSAERTELAVMRADREKLPMVGSGRRAPAQEAIEASMLMSCGMDQEAAGKFYDDKTMDAALSSEHRGAGLHTLMFHACAAAGIHVRPGKVDDSTIRAAFEADRELIKAGVAFSTFSMTGALSNIANKRLRQSFLAVPNYTLELAEQIDTNDFKQFTTYQITGSGQFLPIGVDGTLKLASLSEQGWPNQLDTHGRIIVISRKHLINDDLGVFLRTVGIMGRMAILGLNHAFFTTLLSNPGAPSFFSTAPPPAGNGNLLTGATSALSLSGLQLAEQLFLDMKDIDGAPILNTPKTLLVPTSLKATADQLYVATNLNETTAVGAGLTTAKADANPFAGKFKPLAVPYLNSQSIPGSSATAWYLVGDPNDVPMAQVAYLNGQRTPIVETAETDFSTLGMQFRGYWDIGIALQDPRGAVKMAGV